MEEIHCRKCTFPLVRVKKVTIDFFLNKLHFDEEFNLYFQNY